MSKGSWMRRSGKEGGVGAKRFVGFFGVWGGWCVARLGGFSEGVGGMVVTVSVLLGWFGGECVADVLAMGFLLVIFWRCDGVVVLSTRYACI